MARRKGRVGVITLDRPERRIRSPRTYGELRDLSRLEAARDINGVVVTGAGGISARGGCAQIIGPLTKKKMRKPKVLEFTRMTGDLVKAMPPLPAAVVAAVDACAPARSDDRLVFLTALRHASAKVAFIFTRVGWRAATWAPCAMLPRVSARDAQPSSCIRSGDVREEGFAWGSQCARRSRRGAEDRLDARAAARLGRHSPTE